MKKLLITVLTILLVACGSGLSGTYKDKESNFSYAFKSGKVIVSIMGMASEMDYKVEDGNVKITSPQGTQVFKIVDDKTIEGPMGVKLIKQ
jgi:major membrane immunogen (membrane-anchored lipoprotein)